MSKEDFERQLRTLLGSRPFRPFLVEQKDGDLFTVDDPEAVAFSNGAAGFIGPEIVHFFDFESVKEMRSAEAVS